METSLNESLFNSQEQQLVNYIQETPDSSEKWDHISDFFGLEMYDHVFLMYANSKPEHPRKWEMVGRYFLMTSDEAFYFYKDLIEKEDLDVRSVGCEEDNHIDEFEDDEELYTQDEFDSDAESYMSE